MDCAKINSMANVIRDFKYDYVMDTNIPKLNRVRLALYVKDVPGTLKL